MPSAAAHLGPKAPDSTSCSIGIGIGPGDCIFTCTVGRQVHVSFSGYFGSVTGTCPGASAACDINPITNGVLTTSCERFSDSTITGATNNGACHTDGLLHLSVTCESF